MWEILLSRAICQTETAVLLQGAVQGHGQAQPAGMLPGEPGAALLQHSVPASAGSGIKLCCPQTSHEAVCLGILFSISTISLISPFKVICLVERKQ